MECAGTCNAEPQALGDSVLKEIEGPDQPRVEAFKEST